MSLSTEKNFPESLKNRRLTEVITGINNPVSEIVLNECDDDDDTIRDISEIDDAYWSTSSSLTKKGFQLLPTDWGRRSIRLLKISNWYFEVALWLAGASRLDIWLIESTIQLASVWKLILENLPKTTQTFPTNKILTKFPIEHYEKGVIDDESQKLRNYGQMWKNEQEKFIFPWIR